MECKNNNCGRVWPNPLGLTVGMRVTEDAGSTNERSGELIWIGKYQVAAKIKLSDGGEVITKLSDLTKEVAHVS